MPDRESRILETLEANGSVLVADLSARLGVSAVTIRKDLEQLESRRLLKRTRGGAVPAPNLHEGAFGERMRAEAAAKKAIAQHAARRISDGDVVAFDTSTTAHFIAREVLDRQGLVVITQSLPTAVLLMEQSNAQVIVPGGILRRESSGLVGTTSEQLTGRGRIAKGFFGVTGLSTQLGLLELGLDESESKRALASACTTVYGVFASSKASGFGIHSFCPADEVDGLITDAGFADAAEWRTAGVEVDIVGAPSSLTGAGPASPPREQSHPTKEHR